MAESNEKDTRERVLDAAEHAFAERGFGSTSLRHITQAAGVNLAAVNYHFGTKDALIRAVVVRRIAPLNRERIELLDRLEARSGAGGPSLGELVEAFVGPPLRAACDWRPVVMGLLGQAMHQPSELLRDLFFDQFREVADRFAAAFSKACPELDRREVFWRMIFMVGTMVHAMTVSAHFGRLAPGLRDGEAVEPDEVLRRMVPFLAAGFRASGSSSGSAETS